MVRLTNKIALLNPFLVLTGLVLPMLLSSKYVHMSEQGWIFFLGFLLSFFVYFSWIFSVDAFIYTHIQKNKKYTVPVGRNAFISLILVSILSYALNYFGVTNIGIVTLIGVSILFLYFYYIFLVSKKLVEAEGQHQIFRAGTFLTCLQFFYLPVGVFFISHRLRKL